MPDPAVVDPLTGLDLSILDPLLYQIPLTTNPIQAPEWGWQGHYESILHPDNIPSVFATAQGYDESNPGAAQAHHMDGEGNLYVNVRKNEAGGGGGAGSATVITDTRFESGQCDNGDVVSFGLGSVPVAIVRFCGSAVDQHTYSSTTGSNVRFYLRGDDTGTTVDLGTITWTDFSADGTPIVTPMVVDLTASMGIDTSGIFAGDSTVSVDVSTAFVDVVYSWSLLFKRA